MAEVSPYPSEDFSTPGLKAHGLYYSSGELGRKEQALPGTDLELRCSRRGGTRSLNASPESKHMEQHPGEDPSQKTSFLVWPGRLLALG